MSGFEYSNPVPIHIELFARIIFPKLNPFCPSCPIAACRILLGSCRCLPMLLLMQTLKHPPIVLVVFSHVRLILPYLILYVLLPPFDLAYPPLPEGVPHAPTSCNTECMQCQHLQSYYTSKYINCTVRKRYPNPFVLIPQNDTVGLSVCHYDSRQIHCNSIYPKHMIDPLHQLVSKFSASI